MSGDPQGLEELRAALASPEGTRPLTSDCAPPERVWEAVLGELPSEAEELARHSIRCAGCAEALRVAHAIAAEAGLLVEQPARETTSRPAPRRRAWAIAVTAAGVAALVLILPRLRSQPQLPVAPQLAAPELREGRVGAISSLLSEGSLPREACVLRWSPGPPGTNYRVEVARPDLSQVYSATALTRAELQVPSAVLAGIPRGSTLVWRVEARLPDGQRLASPAFVAQLE